MKSFQTSGGHGSISKNCIQIDIVTAPGDGVNPVVVVTMKNVLVSQYIFHIPEGFSRFALEHKLKPGLGLRAAFVTDISESNGIPGLLMRLRGEGQGGFELFGPHGTLQLVGAVRNICRWKNPAVMVTELPSMDQDKSDEHIYEDDIVSVDPLYLWDDNKYEEMQKKEQGMPPYKKVRYDTAHVLDQLQQLVPAHGSDRHIIFGREYQRCGNMPEGYIWSRAMDVHGARPAHAPKQMLFGYVCQIASSTVKLCVINIRNVEDLGHILQHPCIQDTQHGIIYIVCCPNEVQGRKDFLDFFGCNNKCYIVSRMGPNSDHVLGFEATTKLTVKFHSVLPAIFPLPFHWNNTKRKINSSRFRHAHLIENTSRLTIDRQHGAVVTETQVDVHGAVEQNFAQSFDIDSDLESEIKVLNMKIAESESLKNRNQNSDRVGCKSNKSAAAKLKSLLQKKAYGSEVKSNEIVPADLPIRDNVDPRIIFFGTGSAEPSKYRGPSAILLELGDQDDAGRDGGILLDCGEGTFGQLVRYFGYNGAIKRISSLKLIWISHRHADHIAGVLEILSRRPRELPPVLVFGPMPLVRLLLAVNRATNLCRFTVHHIGKHIHDPIEIHGANQVLPATVRFAAVHHCSDAFAIAITFADDFKLVYSGDTEPCDSLVRLGKGANVLIHEATFEPDMVQDARSKRHSTSAEAIEVACRMGARNTILTHFSQRYPKFPTGIYESGFESSSVGIAVDGMMIPLRCLDELPKLTRVMEYAFDKKMISDVDSKQ